MLDEQDEIHPLFQGAPTHRDFRKLRKRIVREVREAIETYGMIERGARWLVCLSGGKDSYTLLAVLHELKWRGLLPVDLSGLQSGSGSARLSGHRAARIPDEHGRAAPDRISDTYSVVMEKIAARRHHVLAVFAAAARQPVPHRPRRGLFGGGAGPSPRRYSGNLLHEPVSRRAAGHDAAQAGERRRRSVPVSPAGPCGRGRLRRICPGHELSDHPLRSVRQPGRVCSARRSSRCWTTGRRAAPVVAR